MHSILQLPMNLNANIARILRQPFLYEQGTPGWLQQRLRLLTASDAAAVLGLDPYRSAKDVLKRKLGYVKNRPTAATRWGNALEDEAIAKYEAETGQVVHRYGLCAHPAHPSLLGGSPDGLCAYGEGNGKIIEVKCPCE